MKHTKITLLFLTLTLCILGCPGYDSEPITGPSLEDCSTYTLTASEKTADDIDGVDILIAIDTTSSMAEEQALLSNGLYTLIKSLTQPVSSEDAVALSHHTFHKVRVAVVSSDMGLQWGEVIGVHETPWGGETGGNTTPVPGCKNSFGLDGQPQGINVPSITLQSGQIPCDPAGQQCPQGFTCDEGRCMANDGVGEVPCPALSPGLATTSFDDPKADFATQAACMAVQGTDGCSVSQPLKAAVRGLGMHDDEMISSFAASTRALAIIVVSDKEDCSIRDPWLFHTKEWESGEEGLLNVACNITEENESYLFPTNAADVANITKWQGASSEPVHTYRERMEILLGSRYQHLFFAAIVGVPQDEGDTNKSSCQGRGDQLTDKKCLEHNAMAYEVETADISETDNGSTGFAPACTRLDPVTGDTITSAEPGRRYVKVAENFGDQGYVYSICNDDWSPAMMDLAEMIKRQNKKDCYHSQLDWRPEPTETCPDCGTASGDLMAEYLRKDADAKNLSCPDALYAELSEAEANRYKEKKYHESIFDENGILIFTQVYCPIPQIPAPLDEQKADAQVDQLKVGWYYTEKIGENFDDACSDGLDNDNDTLLDCEDDDCATCKSCNGTGEQCATGCRYRVTLTEAAKIQAKGSFVKLRVVTPNKAAQAQCIASENVPFGAQCQQVDLDESEHEPILYPPMRKISFQLGCDCLTHVTTDRTELPGDRHTYAHFCTQPCTDSCPLGFECKQMFTAADTYPEGVSNSYCVPDCIANGCLEQKRRNGKIVSKVCKPSGPGKRDWQCRWPS